MAFDLSRLMSHVDKDGPDGCWIWTGRQTLNGYGKYSGTVAHRATYQAFVGLLTKDIQLDHLCLVLLCVNPDHLDPVDQFENMRRRFALHPDCVNGHAWTAENTYRRPTGQKDCRACIRTRARTYQRRKACGGGRMSAARGTRRPHPRRVYKRGRKSSRTKSKGCALLVFAFLALPALILAVTR